MKVQPVGFIHLSRGQLFGIADFYGHVFLYRFILKQRRFRVESCVLARYLTLGVCEGTRSIELKML